MSTEPWVVHTERENEASRRGYGQEAFDTTLRHLADRGDRTCKVFAQHESGEPHPALVEIDLEGLRSK